jgi:ABC-2 type transport system ATP-binding protein
MVDDESPVVLRDVTKRYGSTTAVRAVTWAPQRGRVTALVGLNGAGKSTLMRLSTGLVRPSGGRVESRPVAGRAVSALIEAPALYAGLSVRRNLAVHRTLTGASRADADRVAALTGIGEALPRKVRTLSQGYRQRAAIAIALLRRPAALLLDEPANALDPEAIGQLRALVRTLADEGAAVVVSTHLLRELEGTADLLTVLHEGRVRYDGPFGAFVGAGGLHVRAAGGGHERLAGLLRAAGLAAEIRADGLRLDGLGLDGAEQTAERVFAVAAGAGMALVELSHRTPTLEDAFQAAIRGAAA